MLTPYGMGRRQALSTGEAAHSGPGGQLQRAEPQQTAPVPPQRNERGQFVRRPVVTQQESPFKKPESFVDGLIKAAIELPGVWLHVLGIGVIETLKVGGRVADGAFVVVWVLAVLAVLAIAPFVLLGWLL
jgi:hypothetical protein